MKKKTQTKNPQFYQYFLINISFYFHSSTYYLILLLQQFSPHKKWNRLNMTILEKGDIQIKLFKCKLFWRTHRALKKKLNKHHTMAWYGTIEIQINSRKSDSIFTWSWKVMIYSLLKNKLTCITFLKTLVKPQIQCIFQAWFSLPKITTIIYKWEIESKSTKKYLNANCT